MHLDILNGIYPSDSARNTLNLMWFNASLFYRIVQARLKVLVASCESFTVPAGYLSSKRELYTTLQRTDFFLCKIGVLSVFVPIACA